MALVNSIDVHLVEKITVEIGPEYNPAPAWINIRIDDFRVTIFARDEEQGRHFRRIAEAIARANAEFDLAAERAEADRLSAARHADAETAFGAEQ